MHPARPTPSGARAWALSAIFAFPAGAMGQAAAALPDTSFAAATVTTAREEASALPVVALAGENGFGLRSADSEFVLRFRGLGQYDGRFFPDDPDDISIDGFDLRRLRADLVGTVYGGYDFRAYIEHAGNRVEILDAYLMAAGREWLRRATGIEGISDCSPSTRSPVPG